jgi:hypothetical protein
MSARADIEAAILNAPLTMNRYFTDRITAIEAMGGHRVRVTFRDGFTGEVDLTPLLDCGPIARRILFQEGHSRSRRSALAGRSGPLPRLAPRLVRSRQIHGLRRNPRMDRTPCRRTGKSGVTDWKYSWR